MVTYDIENPTENDNNRAKVQRRRYEATIDNRPQC